jgi:hypothetical protein
METNKNESNNKTVSLRSLKIWRIILFSGFVLSAIATIMCIVYIAVFAVMQSDIFSVNWWAGIAMGSLAYSVLMIYLFATIIIFEIYDIHPFSFLNRKEWLKKWCEFVIPNVILNMFRLGIILLYVVIFLQIQITNIGQLPIIPSLFAALLFLASIILLALHNETNCQIREKSDPNFRRCRGFT